MKKSYFVRMAIENIEESRRFLMYSEIPELKTYIDELKKIVGDAEEGLSNTFIKQYEQDKEND